MLKSFAKKNYTVYNIMFLLSSEPSTSADDPEQIGYKMAKKCANEHTNLLLTWLLNLHLNVN